MAHEARRTATAVALVEMDNVMRQIAAAGLAESPVGRHITSTLTAESEVLVTLWNAMDPEGDDLDREGAVQAALVWNREHPREVDELTNRE